MIVSNEERVIKALTLLAETDEPHAKAKAMCKYLEQKRKTIKATGFIASEAKTNEAKTQESYASIGFKKVCEEIKNAEYDFQLLTNQRLREQLVIDVWRSEGANKRVGNI